jgi:hypothetical protein
MFDFSGYFAAIKRHWLLFLLTLFVVAVFVTTPFLAAYRKLREVVPGGAALPPK